MMTMMEENRTETEAIIREMCATLDIQGIKSVAVSCYENSVVSNPLRGFLVLVNQSHGEFLYSGNHSSSQESSST